MKYATLLVGLLLVVLVLTVDMKGHPGIKQTLFVTGFLALMINPQTTDLVIAPIIKKTNRETGFLVQAGLVGLLATILYYGGAPSLQGAKLGGNL